MTMLRCASLCWFGVAVFEGLYRHDPATVNTAVIMSGVFWVGAEIVKAIRRRDEPSTTLTNGEA